MRTYLRGKITLLFMMLGMLIAIPAVAYADNLVDTLDGNATSDPSASQTIGAGDSTSTGFTNNYWIVANNAGTSPAGCDVLVAGDSITATFSWPSTGAGSLPAGVTASTNSITFDECKDGSDNNAQSVKFTSNQVGTYTIPAPTKSAGTGTYSTNPSSFTLVVNDNCPGPNGDLSGDLQDGTCAAPVTNHAPTVSNDAGNVSGTEGSQITNSGAFSDADGNGTLTITQVSGAGTVDTDNGDGTWSWSHTPNDQGSGTVVVRASDGTAAVTDTFDWSAANVAPTATFNSPDVDEGTGIALSLTGAADASSADTTAGFEYAFDCGDGNGYSNFSSTSTASCPTTDNGTRSVGAKIRDKDGGVSTYTDSVTVANVAPELSALSLSGNTGTACLSGNTANLSFSFSDVGSDDTHNGTIAWGDGSTTQFTSSPQNNVEHTYGAGTYTITVTVNDDDGDSDSDTGSVSKLYKMSGILSPFNTDGSSTWKYGATIPVKVQITDCAGTPVSGLAPKLGTSLANASTPAVNINEDVFSTSNADTGNVLRYSDPQYIYNFNSKSAAITDQNATYWMSVKGFNAAGQVVTDPAQVNQKFGIKSK